MAVDTLPMKGSSPLMSDTVPVKVLLETHARISTEFTALLERCNNQETVQHLQLLQAYLRSISEEIARRQKIR